jgi:hypothetical protein
MKLVTFFVDLPGTHFSELTALSLVMINALDGTNRIMHQHKMQTPSATIQSRQTFRLALSAFQRSSDSVEFIYVFLFVTSRMRWWDYVESTGEMRNIYNTLVEKPEGEETISQGRFGSM